MNEDGGGKRQDLGVVEVLGGGKSNRRALL